MPTRRLARYATHQKYYLADGSEVGGASTIAKLGDNPEGLIIWANKMGLEGKKSSDIRDKAANSGTIAHFMVDCFFAEETPDLREFEQPEIDTAKIAYDKFMKFWDMESLTWVEKETQLVSEVNHYGGTIDLVARDEYDKLVLLDFKTSKQVYLSHRFQGGGYEMLWNENRVEPIARRAILLISREEGIKVRPVWITDEDSKWHKQVFVKQAELWNVLKKPK